MLGNAGLEGKLSFTAGLLIETLLSVFDGSDFAGVTFSADTFRRSAMALEGVFEICATNKKHVVNQVSLTDIDDYILQTKI